jgi:hypothetical protein
MNDVVTNEKELPFSQKTYDRSGDLGSGVGPQQHIDIICKTFKFSVKKGLKWPFLGPKTHF